MCERSGAELVNLRLPLPLGCESDLVAKLEAALDAAPHVRFALLDHITSPTNLVLPVRELAAVCRRRGVLVMIDGAHAPGQLPLTLSELGVDWYAGNLHKWCYCPKGVAVLYTAAERQAETQSLVIRCAGAARAHWCCSRNASVISTSCRTRSASSCRGRRTTAG